MSAVDAAGMPSSEHLTVVNIALLESSADPSPRRVILQPPSATVRLEDPPAVYSGLPGDLDLSPRCSSNGLIPGPGRGAGEVSVSVGHPDEGQDPDAHEGLDLATLTPTCHSWCQVRGVMEAMVCAGLYGGALPGSQATMLCCCLSSSAGLYLSLARRYAAGPASSSAIRLFAELSSDPSMLLSPGARPRSIRP